MTDPQGTPGGPPSLPAGEEEVPLESTEAQEPGFAATWVHTCLSASLYLFFPAQDPPPHPHPATQSFLSDLGCPFL